MRKDTVWRRLAALCRGVVLIAMLAGAIGSLSRWARGDFARIIEERGVEADGLFYSETEEVAEAFNYLYSSRMVGPGKDS
ncbi:MAG: hypothetical protein AAF517_14150 [Planctomycetota bacterium]